MADEPLIYADGERGDSPIAQEGGGEGGGKAEEKVRNRGWFTKGDPRIAGLQRKKPEGHTETEQSLLEPWDELGDMELVLRTDKKQDRTPAQRHLRRWMEKNFTEYMAKLDRLRAEAKAVPVVESDSISHDTQGLLDMIDRWLEDDERAESR